MPESQLCIIDRMQILGLRRMLLAHAAGDAGEELLPASAELRLALISHATAGCITDKTHISGMKHI
jgi:hypothetical protein